MTTQHPKFFNAKIKTVVSALALSSLCFAALSNPTFAATRASDSFTDVNLRNCVLNIYNSRNGTNLKQLTIKQLETIISLSCPNTRISNAAGLERLTKLENLDLSGNQLSSIDLSKNTKLTMLNLSSNNLRALDVTKLTKLTTLRIDKNRLTTLNVKRNKALTTLHADNILLDANITAQKSGSIFVYDLSALKFYNLSTHLYLKDTYDYHSNEKLLATKDHPALVNMFTNGAGFNYSYNAYRLKLPAATPVSRNTIATQIAKIYRTHAKTLTQLSIYMSEYGFSTSEIAHSVTKLGLNYGRAALMFDLPRLMGYFAARG